VERGRGRWEWKGERLKGWVLLGEERGEGVEKVGVEGFEARKLG